MATTPASKKRKTTAPATHAKCKMHKGDEDVRRYCNGSSKKGHRCTSRVTRTASEEQLVAGYLPVCRVHTKQKIYAGYCEVTASCGQRCNRLVAWTPCTSQRCEEHSDAVLTCHIMRLPAELRMQIIDLLIPGGESNSGIYCIWWTAAQLFRVNKQINSETTTLIYKSKARPCSVSFYGSSFRLLGEEYSLSCKPSSTLHSSQTARHRLHRFQHLSLRFHGNAYLGAQECLYKTLVNIWCLARAIMRDEQGPMISTLHIYIGFGEWRDKPTWVDLGTVEFPIVRALIYTLRSAGLAAAQETIEIEWEPRSRHHASGKLKIVCTAEQIDTVGQVLASEKATIDAFVADATEFQEWYHDEEISNQDPGWHDAYNMFEKADVICKTIRDLCNSQGSSRITHVYASSADYRKYKDWWALQPHRYGDWKPYVVQRRTKLIMLRAIEYFCIRDTVKLKSLLEQLQHMWKTYCEADVVDKVHHLSKALDCATTEPADRDEMFQLAQMPGHRKLVWPKFPERVKLPNTSADDEHVHDVYVKTQVDGREVWVLQTF